MRSHKCQLAMIGIYQDLSRGNGVSGMDFLGDGNMVDGEIGHRWVGAWDMLPLHSTKLAATDCPRC